MEFYERIAQEIFQTYKLDFQDAKRAGGWTNLVWIHSDKVLRLSLDKESDRITREVMLSKYLPKEVGYPENIALGRTEGFEWSLSKRIIGKPLSEVWNLLSFEERLSSIQQIVKIVNAVHSVDISKIDSLARKNPWYSQLIKEESMLSIERYYKENLITSEQSQCMKKLFEQFYTYKSLVKPVLNHGDITADNLLWNEGRIVSLLDFDNSVIAPPELDMYSIINLALEPIYLIFTNKTSQYIEQTRKLVSSLASDLDSDCLLSSYALIHQQFFFERWLQNRDCYVNDVNSYKIICSILNGK